jgi:anti-sigma B factor antagonist
MFSAELKVRDAGRHAVVTLRGELDPASTPTVAAHLVAAAAACGPSIIVDLAGLEYIGYSGLGVLVRVRKWARENDGDLALTSPQQQVRRVLRATGLIDIFSVYPSVELAAVGPRLARARPPAAAQPRSGGDSPIRPATGDTSCGRRREPLWPPPRCGAHRSRFGERDACRRRAAGGTTAT